MIAAFAPKTQTDSTEEHRDTDATLLTGTIIFECTSIDFCPSKNIIGSMQMKMPVCTCVCKRQSRFFSARCLDKRDDIYTVV